MTNRNILFLLIAIALPHPVQGQNTTITTHPWQQQFEQLSDYDDIENDNTEDLYEQLCELEASPINLNAATDDDLRQLAFLSQTQQEELAEYLDRYRPLRSIGELAMIKSMDPLRLQLLQSFAYIGEENKKERFPSLRNITQYGKHEFVATAKIPFYTRKGDRNGYLGYKYKNWMRYTFRYGQYVRIGILGAQDAGEPFFSGGNDMGYDHYAFYIMVRRLGHLKALALGQYKLKFGMGLAMSTGFSLGKTASLAMSSPTNKISPNSSRSDAHFMQGAAATFAIGKHIDITTFFSYRALDATLNDDGSVKTILRTGYHRTISEMQRKHNTSQMTTGGNVGWHGGGWHLGGSGIYTRFDRRLSPNTSQLFRRHAPAGNGFYNISLDYGYTSHSLSVNGETAANDKGAVATLNAISLKTSQTLTLTAIQRYYSYRYYSLFSSAFSEGGTVSNESGVYIGATWAPLARLSILAYSDYAYFPWARYRVSAASHSWDNMVQASYLLSSTTTMAVRYRLHLKQEDYTTENATYRRTTDRTEHRARIAIAYNGSHWSAKTQADAAFCVFPENISDKPSSFGWMLSQSVSYANGPVDATANAGYFNTRDYNSRLYTYERGTLYNFNFPMFYGEGMRMALFIRANISKNLMLIGKFGSTKYFDRDHISSAYQQINKSIQTDMDLQLKWKF